MFNQPVLKQIVEKIKEYDTVIIARHQRPDGDCIGASLGLRALLRASFPAKEICQEISEAGINFSDIVTL